MDHIGQIMRWDPTPLGARAALALSRVLAPLDVDRSVELRDHAEILAVEVGLTTDDPARVPLLLVGEELLVRGFQNGAEHAAEHAAWSAAYFEAHPPTVWHGDWMMDLDGVFETRASVAKSSEGFLPGLEISRLGGDCEPSYGDPVASLDQAIAIAEARESKWHRDDSDAE